MARYKATPMFIVAWDFMYVDRGKFLNLLSLSQYPPVNERSIP